MKLLILTLFSLLTARACAGNNLCLPGDSMSEKQLFYSKLKQDSVWSFKSEKGFVPSMLCNLGRQATFPLRLNHNKIYLLGGVTVATLTLIQFDESIDDKVRPIRSSSRFLETTVPHFTDIGEHYGYILLTGFGVHSVATHNYRAFRTSLLALQAAASAGMWIRVIKTFAARMRPLATYDDPEYSSDHWFGPFGQYRSKYNSVRGNAGFNSFPSGHTGTIFAIATVFSRQYKHIKAVPVAMYSLAGMVAFSRMIEHEHYASDVFVGGVIGYLCARQVLKNEYRLFPKHRFAEKKTRSFFYPFAGSGNYGFEWKIIF